MILARLVAQHFTSCNYNLTGYVALSHARRFVARDEEDKHSLPFMTRSFSLGQLEGVHDLGRAVLYRSTFCRALLNLVQNALEAMPQGGTLTVRGQRTATHVLLQMQDTGSGIPPEPLATIFEPLSTTKSGGTGLGLYIVQEIVAAHGGQVMVESVVGQGTTFTVTLPLSGGMLE